MGKKTIPCVAPIVAALILFLPPGGNWFFNIWHGIPLAISTIILVVISSLALFVCRPTSARWEASLVYIPITVFTMWIVFAMPFSSHLVASNLAEFAFFTSAGLLVTCFCSLPQFLACAVFGSGVQAAICMFQAVTRSSGMYTVDLFRVGGSFGYPTALSFSLAFALPLAFALLVPRSTLITKLSFLAISLAIVLTLCRGAALGAVLALLWSLSRTWAGISLGVRLLAMLAIVILISSQYFRIGTPARQLSTARSNESRVRQWGLAVDMLAKTSLQGVGPGKIRLHADIKMPDNSKVKMQTMDPKNQFLANLLSFGILGGVLTILYGIGAITILKSGPVPFVGLESAFIAVVAICLFDSPFYVSEHGLSCSLLGMMTGLLLKKSEGAHQYHEQNA
jgi:hypothetical protein